MLAVAFIWLGVGSILRPPLGLDPDGRSVVDVVDHGRSRVCCFRAFRGADDVGSDGTAGEDAAAGACDDANHDRCRVMGCIYILLPALFLIFYHRESVRATCQRRDPQIRWTDRCPMPVLALSILCALSALCMPTMVVYRPVMPVFGVVLSGAAGAAVILLMTLAMAYLAWGTYRLQMAAWWGTLLLCIVGILNMVHIFADRPDGNVREDANARGPVGNDAEVGHDRNDVSLDALDGLGGRDRVAGLSVVRAPLLRPCRSRRRLRSRSAVRRGNQHVRQRGNVQSPASASISSERFTKR